MENGNEISREELAQRIICKADICTVPICPMSHFFNPDLFRNSPELFDEEKIAQLHDERQDNPALHPLQSDQGHILYRYSPVGQNGPCIDFSRLRDISSLIIEYKINEMYQAILDNNLLYESEAEEDLPREAMRYISLSQTIVLILLAPQLLQVSPDAFGKFLEIYSVLVLRAPYSYPKKLDQGNEIRKWLKNFTITGQLIIWLDHQVDHVPQVLQRLRNLLNHRFTQLQGIDKRDVTSYQDILMTYSSITLAVRSDHVQKPQWAEHDQETLQGMRAFMEGILLDQPRNNDDRATKTTLNSRFLQLCKAQALDPNGGLVASWANFPEIFGISCLKIYKNDAFEKNCKPLGSGDAAHDSNAYRRHLKKICFDKLGLELRDSPKDKETVQREAETVRGDLLEHCSEQEPRQLWFKKIRNAKEFEAMQESARKLGRLLGIILLSEDMVLTFHFPDAFYKGLVEENADQLLHEDELPGRLADPQLKKLLQEARSAFRDAIAWDDLQFKPKWSDIKDRLEIQRSQPATTEETCYSIETPLCSIISLILSFRF